MFENNNAFSVYFSMAKIRYQIYDETISSLNFLRDDDKINVFINLETVWKYISTVKDLENKLMLDNDFKVNMTADIVNLAAHYKAFFKNNGLNDVNVFLYTTDFESVSSDYKESETNEYYRSYFLNKYKSNPRYVYFKEGLVDYILPNVRKICEFLPNVYLITSKNIESSLIPMVISELDKDRVNFIVSGDVLESQYDYERNFIHHLTIRSHVTSTLSYTLKDYLKNIFKVELTEDEFVIYNNRAFYLLQLACLGNKPRSLEGIYGIGFKTLTKKIMSGIENHIITPDTTSIELLSQLFEPEVQEEVIDNYNLSDFRNSFSKLLEGDKKSITSQIIDRSDINSLNKLNNELFKDNRLLLDVLLR